MRDDWHSRPRLCRAGTGSASRLALVAGASAEDSSFAGPRAPHFQRSRASDVEELHKIGEQFLEIEQFRGQSERLERAWSVKGNPVPQASFRHSLAALSQHLETLRLRQAAFVTKTVEQIWKWVGTGRPRPRPNRSYPWQALRTVPKLGTTQQAQKDIARWRQDPNPANRSQKATSRPKLASIRGGGLLSNNGISNARSVP